MEGGAEVLTLMGPWWAYLLAIWLGTTIGWLMCALMAAAHRADIASGDEPSELKLPKKSDYLFSRN